MERNLKNQKDTAITLMTLVITIVVLLILASVATYSGIEVIRSAKFTTFKTEMKIMQTQVNSLYETHKNDPTAVGKDINGSADSKAQAEKVFTTNASGITDQSDYRYFDQDTITSLNIEGVKGEFFVNIPKRSVVSYEGFIYEGQTYYTLDQLPDGLYNVEYEKNKNIPTFDVSCENWTNGKSKFYISNIEYDDYIEKWEVKYQLKNQNYWNTSEDLSFFVETPGTYIVKIVNGDVESETKEIEAVQANSPKIVSGMSKIMFKMPTESRKGEVITTSTGGFDNNIWYDYGNKKWANAMSEDGSMWVWVPRYAYKINSTNKTIDVKFLIGTTDQYYDESGNIKTAQRAKSATEIVDTTSNYYYVHPAFTDESGSNLNYANGGWDSELTGIWVAKFEAGYATGNNGIKTAEVKASSVKYSQAYAWVPEVESTTGADATLVARNWLDGEYGVKNGSNWEWKNGVQTAIKYPTFQPTTYSMNYINHNDAFNIAKVLTENGNIYGFSNSSTDSHLMKNSEWGAVAYLGHSKYGLNGAEVYINNISLNNSTQSVYGVTGVTTGTTSRGPKTTTIENINQTTGNTASDGVYTWNQLTGQKASCTGNIYGIYDLSGGLWERTAAYVANGNGNLKTNGASMAYDGNTLKTASTKYTTVYPYNEGTSGDIDTESRNNYGVNKYIFGDVIRETSTSGTGDTSWNNDYSYFPALPGPFAVRGGGWINGSFAGLFCFIRTNGTSSYSYGFHPVLVSV